MQVNGIELLIFWLLLHQPTSKSLMHIIITVLEGTIGNWHLWMQPSLMLM